MDTETGCNSTLVSSSVLSTKLVGSMDMSLIYDESILSLHTRNVSQSSEVGNIALAAELESDEKHKLNQSVYLIPDTNPVLSLLPVEESQDSQSDDEDDESEGKEHSISVAFGKQNDGDDVKEIIQDDSSTCWRSDTSNNNISSFTFPILLHNEDGSVETPTMKTRWNVFDKRLQLSQPQTQSQPQLQFYFIPAAATHTLTRLQPHRKSPSLNQASEMQAQKTYRNRWFSCFYCPFQRD